MLLGQLSRERNAHAQGPSLLRPSTPPCLLDQVASKIMFFKNNHLSIAMLAQMRLARWLAAVTMALVHLHCADVTPVPATSPMLRATFAGPATDSRGLCGPWARGGWLTLRGGTGDEGEGEEEERDEGGDVNLARQREERKKAKAEEKLRKKFAKEAARAEWSGGAAGGSAADGDAAATSIGMDVSYGTTTPGGLPEAAYGNLRLVQSRESDSAPEALRGTMRSVAAVAGSGSGEPVWVRARVQNVRFKGNSCFMVLRQGTDTVQATLFKGDGVTKDMLRFCAALPKESYVDVHGLTVSAQVAACSVADTEIAASRLYCVSRSLPVLPLLPEEGGGARRSQV